MKLTLGTLGAAAVAAFLWVGAAGAQDLGPGFHKIKDGIYTFAPDQGTTTLQFCRDRGRCRDDRCLQQPAALAQHVGGDQKGYRQADSVS